MPEVKQHEPGMLCWAELATPDEQAALRFYGSLFGWKDDPQPIGPGETYHLQKIRGLDAAAVTRQRAEQAQKGVPPHWGLYFAVKSADDAAKRVARAKGEVHVQPFDVMDKGRMAVIQDPDGAFFCVWQAASHIGFQIVGEPGAMAWGELFARDASKAAKFYSAVLGVTSEKMPGPMDYIVLKAAGKNAAGIMTMTPEMGPMPPSWLLYFTVADADRDAARVNSLGGRTIKPPQDIPEVGRFAIVQDPQGAMFGIIKPLMR